MHPYVTPKHVELKEEVAAFAREKIAPVATALDESCEFPWENVRTMGDMGLLGVPVPRELGGMGLDYLSYVMVVVPEGDRTPWLKEGGQGSKPIVVHFQMRPDPLAH